MQNQIKKEMKKKAILLLLVITSALVTRADDYTYLTFETTDGTKVSVEASTLTITISGTTLTAGSESFILSNLSKMYFSTSNETTETTAISSLNLESSTQNQEYYDLQGRKVSKDQLRSGQVYIVKTKNGTHKIVMK